jgi:hypothetical protein
MRPGNRSLLATLAAVLCAPTIAWLASEGVVSYEMSATGASSRAELSEDYYLGFLIFMVVPPVTLVGVIAVWFVVWNWFKPKDTKD